MIGVSEERKSYIRKHKVLREEVEELKEFFGPSSRLHRHVDIGVIGLHDATEQHCHYAWGRGKK